MRVNFGRGFGVTKFGIFFISLCLGPREVQFGGMIDHDVITGAHMKDAESIYEEFYEKVKNKQKSINVSRVEKTVSTLGQIYQ